MDLPAAGKGPSLPFPAPAPLKAVLLDVELPLSLPALWLALFHGSSGLLAEFHQQLGDLDISVSPWRLKGAVAGRRAGGWEAGCSCLLVCRRRVARLLRGSARLLRCPCLLPSCARSP